MSNRAKGMAQRPTVDGLDVVELLESLRRGGLAPRALCDTVGLDPATLLDLATRVPTRVVTGILAAAERRAHDPFVGLHAGMCAEPRGLVPYLLLSSPRLEDGLRHAERFSRLTMDTLRVTLEVGGELASLVFHPGDRTFARSRNAMEYLLMTATIAVRRAFGTGFRLRSVYFRHAGEGRRAEVEHAFGCSAHFQQTDDRLVFPISDLRATSRFASPLLAGEIERLSAALESRTKRRGTFREQVAQAIRGLLGAGARSGRGTVARQLHLSDRTLQRRLAQERTSFRDVRFAVLREAVEAMLSNPALKIEAIALSVGFADVAGFSKAFKRWAGCPPTRYRERLLTRLAKGRRSTGDL